MIIEEKDFILEYIDDHDCFDVSLLRVKNAKDASKKREEFEKLRDDYTEKLESQMEQAERIQREMRNRRLSGN